MPTYTSHASPERYLVEIEEAQARIEDYRARVESLGKGRESSRAEEIGRISEEEHRKIEFALGRNKQKPATKEVAQLVASLAGRGALPLDKIISALEKERLKHWEVIKKKFFIEPEQSKPSFSQHIEEHKDILGRGLPKAMAFILASASDNQDAFTYGEMAEMMGSYNNKGGEEIEVIPSALAFKMFLVKERLAKIGIEVVQYSVKRDGPRGLLVKKPAFRLKWEGSPQPLAEVSAERPLGRRRPVEEIVILESAPASPGHPGRPAPRPAAQVVKNRYAPVDDKDYRVIKF